MRDNRSYILLLVALWSVLYLPNLWWRDLTGTDEPKYAQVAREVMLEGHWFALHFNGKSYYGEPPLYFWTEALFSLPRGDVTEFTAMLPACLAALGTILMVYFLGKRLFSPRAGLLAALILASLPQFHKFGCMARLDIPFAFLITSSLAAFYSGYSEPARRRRYFLVAWALVGLAAITKNGPLAFFLVAAVVSLFLWRRKELRLLKQTQPLLGGLILAATVLTWLLPAYLIEGRSYIDGLLGQFGSQIKTPLGMDKFFFYFTEVFAGTLPWSLLLPVAFYLYYKGTPGRQEGVEFVSLWFLTIFFTFSIALQEFSRYILPLYPAVALLLANLWDGLMERPALVEWPGKKSAVIYGLAVILGFLVANIFFRTHTHTLVFSPAIGLVIGSGLLGLMAALWHTLRAKQFRILFVFVFLITGSFELNYNKLHFAWYKTDGSEKPLCLKVAGLLEPGAPWAVYRVFRQAHVFYTKSHPRDIQSEEELISFLSSREKVYCLLREDDYNSLNPRVGLPLFEVEKLRGTHKKAKRLLLISNKPSSPS